MNARIYASITFSFSIAPIQQIIIQVIACHQNKMESQLRANEQPFAAAFVSCSLDPCIQPAKYSQHHLNQYFITDIKLIRTDSQISNDYCEEIRLNENYSLLIERDPTFNPIVDVANFEQIPEGWEVVKIDQRISEEVKSILCFRRGLRSQHIKCIHHLQIYDENDQQKMEEATQPSLTDKSQLLHSYLKIQIGYMKKYLNFSKRSQIQTVNLRFKPITQSLFQKVKGQLDIPNLAILCFPEGVRVFKKQSGFKFFSFILTTDAAERFYCNSIIFSQKLPNQIYQKLYEKYGIKNQRGIFSQKIFTLISQHNCTDQTNKCLQYLYRVYLSKSQDVFKQKINKLPTTFTLDLQTKKSKFLVQDFGLCFKINSSYPQTSTQAIYGIFKFLQIQNIVTIVQNLLLQRKIFFISDCQNMVGMAIQAFLSFIYPMNWIHGIINPLSSSMIEYTQAPMTITFGLSNQLAKKIKPSVDGLFVYLDYNKVELKNNQQIHLMTHLRKQLVQRLIPFNCYDFIDVRDYLNNPENLSLFKTQQTQDPHFDAYKIRNIFFQLTVFMLRNYKDYFLSKEKKNALMATQRVGGIKKNYDLNSILHLYRKDPFMTAFLQTSLFSVLIEKKIQQPDNKWIKTLDRAIRKIAGFKKHYIQQQSDNCSDTTDIDEQNEYFLPRGCKNLISFTSRESEQQKNPKSSPSPRKNVGKQDKQLENKSMISPKKNVGRMSLPSQYEKRHNSALDHRSTRTSIKKQTSNDSQKDQKQTDKGSESCGKSESEVPELPQKDQIIVYQFDADGQDEVKQQGVASLLCSFFSYPYKKMTNSVVTRWTKKKFNKLTAWKKKNIKQQDMCKRQAQLQQSRSGQKQQRQVKKQDKQQ